MELEFSEFGRVCLPVRGRHTTHAFETKEDIAVVVTLQGKAFVLHLGPPTKSEFVGTEYWSTSSGDSVLQGQYNACSSSGNFLTSYHDTKKDLLQYLREELHHHTCYKWSRTQFTRPVVEVWPNDPSADEAAALFTPITVMVHHDDRCTEYHQFEGRKFRV